MSEGDGCCVYVRGLSKRCSRQDITTHFSTAGAIKELVWSEDPQARACCRVVYEDEQSAAKAVATLHHTHLLGVVLSVRPNLGREKHSINTATTKRFSAAPRTVGFIQSDGSLLPISTDSCPAPMASDLAGDEIDSEILDTAAPGARGKGKKRTRVTNSSTYTDAGVTVNGQFFPSPRGVYLTKVLELCHSSTHQTYAPLLDIILGRKTGNKHAKELTESMAMVSGIWRLFDTLKLSLQRQSDVTVFVLGDGVVPFTAAALALFMPDSWRFMSIDPLMSFSVSPESLGPYCSRINVAAVMSQDFELPLRFQTDCEGATGIAEGVVQERSVGVVEGVGAGGELVISGALSIVVACHSHAPLQEFWDRLASPKLCVSMPCCGKNWSVLEQEPLLQYDDFEVFSAKRKVFLYNSL